MDSRSTGWSATTTSLYAPAVGVIACAEGRARHPSFVRQFYDKTFHEAVSMLLGLDGQGIIPIVKQEPEPQEPKPFALPKPHLTMRRMGAYLTKHRCIDRDVVTAFVQEKLLYEDDPHHNCVFIGLDENGEARHAHLRSTSSPRQSIPH